MKPTYYVNLYICIYLKIHSSSSCFHIHDIIWVFTNLNMAVKTNIEFRQVK